MNYFKGSRRRVRKSTSLVINNSSDSVPLETGNTSTGHQVADLPEVDRTQRKRSRDSNKTERTQKRISRVLEKTERSQQKRSTRGSDKIELRTLRKSRDSGGTEKTQRKRSRDSDKSESETTMTNKSKKRKAQHSKRISQNEASSVQTQRAKKKSTRKATKRGESASSMVRVAAEQSNNQPDQNGHLSTSESDGNLNLSDKRDSLILHDTNEQQSDRHFLQQQIKILKTAFQFEEDCPALAKIRANDPKHLPLEAIQNTLRKVNHKTEDEILRNLNRTAQRKLLSNLEGTRHEKDALEPTCVSDQQLLESRYKEVQSRVANLEEMHDKFQQEHAQHKHIGVLVSQLEAVSKEFSGKKLIQEVKRTNTINLGVKNGLSLSDNAPITHQQLVQILFKN